MDVADLAALRQAARFFSPGAAVADGFDLNGDGQLNAIDVALLRRRLRLRLTPA